MEDRQKLSIVDDSIRFTLRMAAFQQSKQVALFSGCTFWEYITGAGRGTCTQNCTGAGRNGSWRHKKEGAAILATPSLNSLFCWNYAALRRISASAEVSVQQALECLAVSGLVPCHLVNGIIVRSASLHAQGYDFKAFFLLVTCTLCNSHYITIRKKLHLNLHNLGGNHGKIE